MVYKKYIKRGGKIYGPYLYKSRKENGKVITEYLGNAPEINKNTPDKKFNFPVFNLQKNANFVLIFLALIFIFSLLFFANKNLTGNVTLLLENNYQAGEQIIGNLKLNLIQDEILSNNTKIIINNSGEISEFSLPQISEQQNKYADIYFTLLLEQEKQEEIKSSGGGSDANQSQEETNQNLQPAENITETPSSESIETPTQIESQPVEETQQIDSIDESQTESSQTTETTDEPETPIQQIESSATESSEETSSETQSETSTDSASTESTSESSISSNSESSSASGSESSSSSSESLSSSSDSSSSSAASSESSSSSSDSGITGAAIQNKEISGIVSKENPFIYNLEDKQKAELSLEALKQKKKSFQTMK